MMSSGNIQVQNLDHLGLVAGIIDEIGLVEIINEQVGIQPGEIVTAGQVVKAILLNGLGFVSRALYLFGQFFEDKAIEHLLGEGIRPEHLNDDKIGRVMDKLYCQGLSSLFLLVSLAVVKKYGISTQNVHLDASSFSLHGQYNCEWPQVEISMGKGVQEKSTSDQPIKITQGYSRDKRPDLKQFILDLIVSGDGDVPLFLRVADGNESDKAVFGKIAQEFSQKVNFESLIVSDSALYSKGNLQLMQGMMWLCRVPLSIKEAKQLISKIAVRDLIKSQNSGYSWQEVQSNYGRVDQRWLVVESQERKQADLKRLEKNLQQELAEALQKLRQLSNRKFESQQGALEITKEFSKKLKYHRLTGLRILQVNPALPKSPREENISSLISYKVQADLELDEQVVAAEKNRAGRFVLATNVLDSSQLSPDEVLTKYKEQQAPERGFAFLKDPLFFADSVFLKSNERVETMAMLMGLCLLVYTLGQRQLRLQLHQCKIGIKNQLGQLTDRPTWRWVFQCFQGIHVVIINGIKQIVNLTDERWWTLSFFPKECQKYYFLS
jgi:transposase